MDIGLELRDCTNMLQQQPKGVLSLGLPPNMIPANFAEKFATSKRQQSATSEVIHHYYETLSPKYANINNQRHKV